MTTAPKEYIQSTFETVKARNGHEAEFFQAAEEPLGTCFLKTSWNTSKKTFCLYELRTRDSFRVLC